MKVKTYKAMDMQEAIRQIRQDLGPEAVILSTRKVIEGKRAFGLLGRPRGEVTAAGDGFPGVPEGPAAQKKLGGESNSGFGPKVWELVRNEIQDLRKEVYGLARTNQNLQEGIRPEVEQGLEELRWWASYMCRQFGQNRECEEADWWRETFLRLVRQGVKEVHALRIMDRLEQEESCPTNGEQEALDNNLTDFLSRLVRVDVPKADSGPRVLALVGPTGVGKTTTAAKIGAQWALGEERKVALITNDTYRIAAVEQLRIYARIMAVPMEVVLNPSELPQVLDGFADKDLILIDTVGRSPFDEGQMGELQTFLESDDRIESLLLLSANTDPRILERVIQLHLPLNPRGLIVTKLDEATSFGALFSASLQSRLPFAFFTNGQRVPEDLCEATPEDVACWTLLGIPSFHNLSEQAAGEG
jgi:flagellar biosynthesis protein FlhF